MNVLIVNNGTRHIRSLANIFDACGDVSLVSGEVFRANDVEPNTLVVLSGSKNHPVLYETTFYNEQAKLIEEYRGPIIGICAGFEVVAKTLGASITRRRRRLHRLVRIGDRKVYEAHRYSVKRISRPLEALAESRSGIEIIKHHNKPIYGVQFHPEVTKPRNDGALFLYEILEQIKQ